MPRICWVIPVVFWFSTGCLQLPREGNRQTADADRPKTLLRWSTTKDKDSGKEKDPGNEKDKDKGKGKDNGKEQDNGKNNGNGEVKEQTSEESQPDEIVTDRPTFTPASRTVGLGHVQLETGYTFSFDRVAGSTTFSHSYPEAELRIGTLANWLELRVEQNFLSTSAPTRTTSGAADLLVGTKLWLTEKDRFLPETSLIVQTTVPSGSEEFTNRKMLPGLVLVYSWDLIPNRITLSGSSQANAAVDSVQHSYLQLAQSLVAGYTLTQKLGAFTEWYALLPDGAITGAAPQYVFDSGFTYKVTSNVQLDLRAGMGLNRSAPDFLAGAGFSCRY